MMKKLILLLMLMIPCNLICGQDTLKVTNEQIKIANLIFAEHQKYSEEIPLLKRQICNLEEINNSWKRTDSIKSLVIENKNKSIKDLNRSLQKKQKIIKYGGTISMLTIFLCLLLK